MVPRAKKVLHESELQLQHFIGEKTFARKEIFLFACIRSARSVTWTLINEYKNHDKFSNLFMSWYGDPSRPAEGTKSFEMKNDELCAFFVNLRNDIEKKGQICLKTVTRISEFNASRDVSSKPDGFDHLMIGSKGVYSKVHTGKRTEDMIPHINVKGVHTAISFCHPPLSHMGKKIEVLEVANVVGLYLGYLKKLVEDWTEIINKHK